MDAADGYRAVFALPRLDHAFTKRVILLADRRGGNALSVMEGPLRVVVIDEKRQGRRVGRSSRYQSDEPVRANSPGILSRAFIDT